MTEETKSRILLVSVFALGVGLLALEGNTSWPFAPNPTSFPELVRVLFRGLGEAFIIAVVLAFVVDAAAKRRLLQEVVRDVSGYILGSERGQATFSLRS